MATLERKRLRHWLLQWQAGEMSERDVHKQAEALWDSTDWPQYPDSDYRSVAVEVLSQLDTLNHQLITISDISTILGFLDTPRGRELDGWRRWRQYWKDIDYDARKRDLAGNPYYAI